MGEVNQVREIYDDLRGHPWSTAQEVVDRTGWNLHVVTMAVRLMIERGRLQERQDDGAPEPRYAVTGES